MNNKGKKIISGIIIAILSVILIINIVVVLQVKMNKDRVPGIFGYKPFIVLSGSMETEIKVGDLVFVKEVDASTLKVNDIIAFRDDELVTTHRIVKLMPTENDYCFETKGDANNSVDKEVVCSKSIEGIYVGRIPKIGKTILFIQEPLGFTIMMMIIIIICILIFMAGNKNNKKYIDEEELKEFEEFKKAKAKKAAANKKKKE